MPYKISLFRMFFLLCKFNDSNWVTTLSAALLVSVLFCMYFLHVLFEIVPCLQCTLFLHCKVHDSNHDITSSSSSALNWFCYAMYLLSEIVRLHFSFITHFLYSDGNFAEQCCFRPPFLLVFDHCCNYNILATHEVTEKSWNASALCVK